MTDSAALEIAPYLPEIFDSEAGGILQDLIFSSELSALMFMATEAQMEVAKKYVVGVLEECYQAGHLQVMGAANEGEFYGYALIFGHPKASLIRYCHKIYVHEQYRGHGIGSQMLEALLSQPYEMGLLCSSELVPFYEAAGMVNKGDFFAPDSSDFDRTRGMYAGLCVMSSKDTSEGLPVFMLNNSDVQNIINAVVACKD